MVDYKLVKTTINRLSQEKVFFNIVVKYPNILSLIISN